jgi:hypothetical protein
MRLTPNRTMKLSSVGSWLPTLQVSIGNLASEDCFDACVEKRVMHR